MIEKLLTVLITVSVAIAMFALIVWAAVGLYVNGPVAVFWIALVSAGAYCAYLIVTAENV